MIKLVVANLLTARERDIQVKGSVGILNWHLNWSVKQHLLQGRGGCGFHGSFVLFLRSMSVAYACSLSKGSVLSKGLSRALLSSAILTSRFCDAERAL